MGALLSQAVSNQLSQFPQGTPTPDQESLQHPSIISEVMGRLMNPHPFAGFEPSQYSMPPTATRAQRIAQAGIESKQADAATQREEQRIREWYRLAQQGEHKVESPVDQDLLGSEWQRRYQSYLFNYNNVVDQMNKADEAFKAGKMSQADYDKANLAMLPVQRQLDATIRQLDAERMIKARQMLKQMHGDFQI